jgi:hypothetical protein
MCGQTPRICPIPCTRGLYGQTPVSAQSRHTRADGRTRGWARTGVRPYHFDVPAPFVICYPL